MLTKLLPILAVGALLAQEPNKPSVPTNEKGLPVSIETITGCLSEEQGTFMIANAKGDRFTLTGKTDLAAHKNHTVKLTGKGDTSGAHPSFEVASVEHVANTCPAN